MLVLKGFDPEDVSTIVKLVREAFGKDYSRDLFFEMGTLFPEEFMTVFDDSKLIGFLIGALTSPKEARVLIFVIDRQYRGRGIGTQVMNGFIDHCRKKGIERIRLEVKTNNENATRLYKKFGFKAVDILEKYYRDGNDGYLMYLEL